MPIYTTVLSASQTITGSNCAIDIGGMITAQGPVTVADGTRLEVTGNAKIKNLDEV